MNDSTLGCYKRAIKKWNRATCNVSKLISAKLSAKKAGHLRAVQKWIRAENYWFSIMLKLEQL